MGCFNYPNGLFKIQPKKLDTYNPSVFSVQEIGIHKHSWDRLNSFIKVPIAVYDSYRIPII